MPFDRKEQIEQLREGLIKNLTLDFFEEEETAAILRGIEAIDLKLRQKALALCFALSHASSSLVPNTLQRIKRVSQSLSVKDTERWITHAFDLLDSQGIDSFLVFTSKTEQESLREFQSPEGLCLQEIAPLLETFLRGISGMVLKIAADTESYTDTATVYLPPLVNRFRERQKNFLLYKLMAMHKWAEIAGGTLTPDEAVLKGFVKKSDSSHPDIDTLFRVFPLREVALDLYQILEALRLDVFLSHELPGLMKEAEALRTELFDERSSLEGLSDKTAFVEGLYQYYLNGRTKGSIPQALEDAKRGITLLKGAESSRETLNLLFNMYEVVKELKGDYEPLSAPLFLGSIKPEKVSRCLRARKSAGKKTRGYPHHVAECA